MPTVLNERGFKVRIYPNDHLPFHVHVIKGSGEVKVQLGSDLEVPSLDQVKGKISNKDVKAALELVTENQQFLILKWKEIHDV